MISVLIVDDEQFVRVALRTLYDWEGNGFRVVDTAFDGWDALEKIRLYRPAVVITDIFMPNMDGLELLERIRQDGFDCVTLVVSNAGDVTNVKTAMKLGAEDYYLKVDYEHEEFHRVMSRIKEAVLKRRGGVSGPEQPDALSGAQFVADACDGKDWSDTPLPPITDLYCIRTRDHASKSLDSFDKLYRPLCHIVRELFKTEPSLSLAPLRGALLAAVECGASGEAAGEIVRKLAGQIEVYLQARADILHVGGRERFTGELLDDTLDSIRRHVGGAGREVDEIQRIKDYVQEHIGADVYLSDVARHTGLNASYLSRMFKQRTGMGFIAYVTGEKMKRAAQLLSGGRYKVREVASLLGIDDQYYFNKLFKKYHQVTPSEYARENASGGGTE